VARETPAAKVHDHRVSRADQVADAEVRVIEPPGQAAKDHELVLATDEFAVRPGREVAQEAGVVFREDEDVVLAAHLALPSERPPESLGEPPRIFNLVPANLRKDTAPWILRSI
jgi:hypothetical protein